MRVKVTIISCYKTGNYCLKKLHEGIHWIIRTQRCDPRDANSNGGQQHGHHLEHDHQMPHQMEVLLRMVISKAQKDIVSQDSGNFIFDFLCAETVLSILRWGGR